MLTQINQRWLAGSYVVRYTSLFGNSSLLLILVPPFLPNVHHRRRSSRRRVLHTLPRRPNRQREQQCPVRRSSRSSCLCWPRSSLLEHAQTLSHSTLRPLASSIRGHGQPATTFGCHSIGPRRSPSSGAVRSTGQELSLFTAPIAYCSAHDADNCFCDSQGTGIRVQGKIQGNQSAVLFSLDNSTTVAPPAPYLDWMIYAVSGLESGDHQLLMSRLPVNNIATNFYLYNIMSVLLLPYTLCD